MTHSDDTGLVLPPKVAPIQVIIVQSEKGQGIILRAEFADTI